MSVLYRLQKGPDRHTLASKCSVCALFSGRIFFINLCRKAFRPRMSQKGRGSAFAGTVPPVNVCSSGIQLLTIVFSVPSFHRVLFSQWRRPISAREIFIPAGKTFSVREIFIPAEKTFLVRESLSRQRRLFSQLRRPGRPLLQIRYSSCIAVLSSSVMPSRS